MIALKNRYVCLSVDDDVEDTYIPPVRYSFHVKNLVGDLLACELVLPSHQTLIAMDIYASVWESLPKEWKPAMMTTATNLRLAGLSMNGDYEETEEAVIQTVCEGGVLAMCLQEQATYQTGSFTSGRFATDTNDIHCRYRHHTLTVAYSETGEYNVDRYGCFDEFKEFVGVSIGVYVRIPPNDTDPLLYYRSSEVKWNEKVSIPVEEKDLPYHASGFTVTRHPILSKGRPYTTIAEIVREEIQRIPFMDEEEIDEYPNWKKIPPGAIHDIIQSGEGICCQR